MSPLFFAYGAEQRRRFLNVDSIVRARVSPVSKENSLTIDVDLQGGLKETLEGDDAKAFLDWISLRAERQR
jgi:hypothetical protein